MKSDKIFTVFWGFLISFALGFACSACLATAFATELSVNMKELALWCAFYALLASVCFTFRMSLPFVAFSLILVYIFCKYTDFVHCIQSTVFRLSVLFDEGYSWGVVPWGTADAAEHTRSMQAVGSLVCALVAWTICQRRSTFWALLGAIIPFMPCTFLLKTVPDVRYLLLWLLALMLIILTQPTRKDKEREGNKLAAYALIPTALAVLALFALVPQERYSGRAGAEAILERVEQYFETSKPPLAAETTQSKTVDLSDVGAQEPSYSVIMEVFSPRDETCYLRARAYDVYDGTTWSDSGEETALAWREYFTERESLRIRTRRIEPYLFQPYRLYPNEHTRAGNALKNEDQSYDYTYLVYAEGDYTVAQTEPNDRISDEKRLTELPGETLRWAIGFWQETLLPGSAQVSMRPNAQLLAECIDGYFSANKEYSLQISSMPSDEDDFAKWFTEESDTGYCVHFATAATVLLRAQGVPARYVTGYVAKTGSAHKTNVYAKDAHAWVEYWTAETGWTVFDPTPSEHAVGGSSANATAPSTVPTQNTQPAEPTEPSTERETTPKPTLEPKPQTPNENNGAQARPDEPFVIPETVRWVVLAMGLLLLIFLQSRVRVVLKRRARERGSHNERALNIWKQLKKHPKTDLAVPFDIAQKARFSNRPIAEAELSEMQSCFDRRIRMLRKRAWYYRLIDRIIFARY